MGWGGEGGGVCSYLEEHVEPKQSHAGVDGEHGSIVHLDPVNILLPIFLKQKHRNNFQSPKKFTPSIRRKSNRGSQTLTLMEMWKGTDLREPRKIGPKAIRKRDE